MITFPRTTIKIIFLVAAVLCGGTVGVSLTKTPHCLDAVWIAQTYHRCFQQYGLIDDKFPLASDFMHFLYFFMNSDGDICERQGLNQLTKAYQCVTNSTMECFRQLSTMYGDEDEYESSWIQAIEGSIPDPDALKRTIHFVCDQNLTGSAFDCIDNPDIMYQLLICVLTFSDSRTRIHGLPTTAFQPVICSYYEKVNQCTGGFVQQCGEKMVHFVSTFVQYLTPPICLDGVVATNINHVDHMTIP